MYCKHCGKELEDGAIFCTRCGKPVQGQPVKKEPEKSEKKNHSVKKKTSKKPARVIMAAAVLALAVAGYKYIRRKRNRPAGGFHECGSQKNRGTGRRRGKSKR